MGDESFGRRDRPDGAADRGQALPADPLDLAVPPERADVERPGAACQPAGGQDVVGAGCVVAGALGSEGTDEERAGGPDAVDGFLGVRDDDGEMLGGVVVDE